MDEKIPILRVYFLLHCPVGVAEATLLENGAYSISDQGQAMLIQRVFRGRGSSWQPPFVGIEIGYELHEYGKEKFERYTDQLFSDLHGNAARIKAWAALDAITASFVVNFNSMAADQRPVFFLRPDQAALLAAFGASVNFDGYLMLDD